MRFVHYVHMSCSWHVGEPAEPLHPARLRPGPRLPARRSARAEDAVSRRPSAVDHRHQRQPGRRLHPQRQPVSRLRARLRYCYARPYHEYLGFSAGLDFETKIMVKEDAAGPAPPRTHVAEVAAARRWSSAASPTATSRSSGRSRSPARCLEVCREFRNPVGIITKNALVCRDIDVLRRPGRQECGVRVPVGDDARRRLGGQAGAAGDAAAGRLAAIARFRDAGVPVGVMAAPMIPGLNDHELPAILAAARDAGAGSPATRWCGCRWRSARSSPIGSRSISPIAKKRCWAGSATATAAGSTTGASASA